MAQWSRSPSLMWLTTRTLHHWTATKIVLLFCVKQVRLMGVSLSGLVPNLTT